MYVETPTYKICSKICSLQKALINLFNLFNKSNLFFLHKEILGVLRDHEKDIGLGLSIRGGI